MSGKHMTEREKKIFLGAVLDAAFQTLEMYKKVEYVYDDENGNETVVVTCNNDYKYEINVSCDSILAMLHDISGFLLKHN